MRGMYVNVLAFTLGVCLLQQCARLPSATESWLLAGAGLVFVALDRCLAGRRTGALLLTLACALAGFGWAAMRAEWRLAEALPGELEGRDVSVIGVVDALPEITERGVRFWLRVEQSAEGLPSRLELNWYRERREGEPRPPLLAPGQRWQLVVRLRRPHASLNPHAPDREARWLEQGVRATGYVRSREPYALLTSEVGGWRVDIERVRATLRQGFEAHAGGSPWNGLMIALTLGDQQSVPEEQWELFRRTGIVHLVVVSGMHITLMGAFGGLMAGGLWRRTRLALVLPAQKFAVLAGFALATGYALLAGFGIPVQRSLLMLATIAACLLLDRRVAPTRILALALLVVVAADPWAVLAPGFWLSFGAVAILLMIALGERRDSSWLRAAVHAQLAINLAMIPLLLVFFQQFSLVSPLANLVAVPLLSFVVMPLCLVFAAIPLPPLLALAQGLTDLLMIFINWLGAFGLAVWQQAAAPPLLLLAAGAGCLWLLLPRGTPGRLAALLALVPALAWQAPRPPPGAFELTVLDVGQGLAVHLRTAAHELLFDAGPAWPGGDSGERSVLPYLRAEGVGALDLLVLSHDDSDHSGGADSVLAGLPVASRVTEALDPRRASGDGEWQSCSEGGAWNWDGVRFRWLNPPADGTGRAGRDGNHRSCVLGVEGDAGRALLAADIEASTEKRLTETHADALRADLVLAPHHGSRTSSSAVFVGATGARAVIYSVGYRSQFGHPHPEVWARWAAAGATGFRTDSQGAIRARFAEGRIDLLSEREVRARYWHGR